MSLRPQDPTYLDTLYGKTGGEPEKGFNFWGEGIGDTATDIFAGAFNGAEEAVRGFTGLAEYAFGAADDQVDWDFVEDPDSIIGQLAGGVTQYVAGSAMIYGLVTAGLSGLIAIMAVATPAVVVAGTAAAAVAKVGQFTAKLLGKYTQLAKSTGKARIGYEFMIQAPLVDVAAYEADEGRFVDILNEYDPINNVVFDWIQGDEDDSILTGRLKNVADGLVGGIASEGAIQSMKALAKGMKAMRADPEGLNTKSIQDQVASDLSDASTSGQMLEEGLLDGETLSALEYFRTKPELSQKVKDAVETFTEGDLTRGDLMSYLREIGRESEGVDTLLGKTEEGLVADAKKLNVNQRKLPQGKPFLEKTGAEGLTPGQLGPVNVPAGSRGANGQFHVYTFYDENVEPLGKTLGIEEPNALKGALDKSRDRAKTGELLPEDTTVKPKKEAEKKPKKEKEEDILLAGEEFLLAHKAMVGGTATARELVGRHRNAPAVIIGFSRFANKTRAWSDKLSSHLDETLTHMRSGAIEVNADTREDVARSMSVIFETMETYKQISGAFGRGLESFKRLTKIGRAAETLTSRGKRKFGETPTGEQLVTKYRDLARKADTDPKALKQVKAFEDDISRAFRKSKSTADFIEKIEGSAASRAVWHNLFGGLSELRVINLISGPKTIMTAAVSPFILEPYKALRGILGEVYEQSLKGGDASFDSIARAAQRENQIARRQLMHSVKFTKMLFSAEGRKGLEAQMREIRTNVRFELGSTDYIGKLGSKFANKMGLPDVMRAHINSLHKIAVPGRMALTAMDQVAQLSTFRALHEVDTIEKAIAKGMDPERAVDEAALLTQNVMEHSDRVAAHFTGDEIMNRALKAEDIGEVGATKAVLRELESTKKNKELMDETFNRSRVRAQGITLNRPIRELAESKEEIGSDLVRAGTEIAGDVAAIVKAHPILKMFAPFLTVPTNVAAVGMDAIIGGAMENMFQGIGRSQVGRFPGVESFMKQFSDPDEIIRKTQAINGYVAGMVVASFGALASRPNMIVPVEGVSLPMITGGGPKDPVVAAALRQSGWQEYSILVNGKYISYQRIEPIASWLSLMTDTIQLAHYFDYYNTSPEADKKMEMASLVLMTTFSRQITDKTFTQGLGELFQIMDNDGDSANKWFLQTAKSLLIPASVRETANYFDQDLHEARNLLEEVYEGIPGFSKKIKDKKRDILGEPITRSLVGGTVITDLLIPARAREVRDTVINRELRLVPNVWRPAPRRHEGIDLTDVDLIEDGRTIYDRWQEKATEITINGLTMRQAMRKLIARPEYQAYDPKPTDENSYSPRAGMLQSQINRFRKAAFTQMLREDSKLANKFRQVKRAQRARRIPQARRTLFD